MADILDSRAVLEGWGQAIYDKTCTDTLPGVDAAKRTEIQTALQNYKDTQIDQTTSQARPPASAASATASSTTSSSPAE